MSTIKNNNRIITLDLLRGYFIFVIIVDHLLRWPSILAWGTGQGRLWVSAAEGFFIISGLLVGYTRGYKKRTIPLKKLTALLYKRAFVLYLSGVISTAILLFIALRSSFPTALLPELPLAGISILALLWQVISLHFVFEWVYFLKLYSIALLMTPLFMVLLRKNKQYLYVITTLLVWLAGAYFDKDWMQWQVLFFIPALFGYHLEAIRSWWQKIGDDNRTLIRTSTIMVTIFTIILSIFFVFGWSIVEQPNIIMSFDQYVQSRLIIDPIFARDPISVGRVLLSFLWFAALFLFVRRYENYFKKLLGWLFIPLGERSLSAYILHGFLLVFVQSQVPESTNKIFNTALSLGIVLAVWTLLKINFIKKILPR